jgi:hypothetical protein
LALKGKTLTAEEGRGCYQIVRPEILAWFRRLAAQKCGSSEAPQ